MPYKQGEDKRRHFSMYIFLPEAKDGLPSLMHKVYSEYGLSDEFQRFLPTYPVEVGDFRIPKFKISYGFDVSKILKELGVVCPFGGEEGITEMVESKLHVSKIIQKSFVEVNEEGTEAAAATVVVVGMSASAGAMERVVKVDFVADHPFLYFIREDLSGTIVLVGTVINPLE
ncbi:unnamed protein product [Cuscuta campestris]|uniref:Serpin domain-containing protein n=1 Tax=Cuscuta campestris TaxID=132261 RepID=A0A484NF63_9ASTE|nr:unnamed protein product [Cuscuta campestris]